MLLTIVLYKQNTTTRKKIPPLPTKSSNVVESNISSRDISSADLPNQKNNTYTASTNILPSYDKSSPELPTGTWLVLVYSTGLTLGLIRTSRQTRQSWETIEYVV